MARGHAFHLNLAEPPRRTPEGGRGRQRETDRALPDSVRHASPGFSSGKKGGKHLEERYQPTGEVRIPPVTPHTTMDPVVPILHEPLFAKAVTANGSTPLLQQRTMAEFGHCDFTTAQTVDGFETLARWVATGVRPTV